MDPNQTCDLLLSYLKKSNLNFSLSESPFAATIYLKKSFIVDKHGVSRTSGITEQPVSEVNIALKNIITGQQSEIVNYQHALHDLGMNLEKAKHELLEVLDDKNQVLVSQESLIEELEIKGQEIACLKEKLSTTSHSTRPLILPHSSTSAVATSTFSSAFSSCSMLANSFILPKPFLDTNHNIPSFLDIKNTFTNLETKLSLSIVSQPSKTVTSGPIISCM